MFGRNSIYFTVNNLSAKVIMGKLVLESRFKTGGRMDAWTRKDLHTKLYDVTVYSAHASVLEVHVSKAKRDAPVEFWKEKKIEEAVLDDMGRSGENSLAGEGESEAKETRRSTCFSPKVIAGPRRRIAETKTKRTRRLSSGGTSGRITECREGVRDSTPHY